MKKASILVVDDEPSIRESFNLILGNKYELILAATAEAALKQVADNPIDLAFLDVRMPGISGIESLQKFKKIDPSLPIIMVTAVSDMQKASLAIKNGAREYIVKPFDVNHILGLAEKILEEKDSSLNIKEIYSFEEEKNTVEELVGQSEKIKIVREQIDVAAQENFPVLILGEIGTEKSVVAKLIHKKSSRATFAFVQINLRKNMTAAQLEDLFFGKTSGQDTSTLDKEEGLLTEVRGGTLFINHSENLPAGFEAKILNLETRLIFTGEHKNASLNQVIKSEIPLPPLRERITDIAHLVNYLIARFCRKYGKRVKGTTKETLDILQNYPWPQNNEELTNVLKIAFLSCSQELIAPKDLPFFILSHASESISREEIKNISLAHLTQEIEKKIIDKSLQKNPSEKVAALEMEITPAYLNFKRENLRPAHGHPEEF